MRTFHWWNNDDVSKTRRSKHNTPSSGESLEWDSYHHQTDEADISDDDVGSIDLHGEFACVYDVIISSGSEAGV